MSSRLHPKFHARDREDGAVMTCRRSPRLHPQIHTSEDGAGKACRRSPRNHPQIHATEQGAGITRRCRRRRRRRRGTSLPDNEDMLWEILLRLPPQPSSLPRASAVCRRWRGLVTDPRFLRSFRAHHRKPPLLGVFESFDGLVFNDLLRQRLRRKGRIELRFILETPDRIPLLPIETGIHSRTRLLGCRHGRLILLGGARKKVSVCDPITGELHRVCTPPDFTRYKFLNVAVLCAAADQGHVHGSCHSSPFKVVMMSPCGEDDRPIACVYSSETGVWGHVISTTARCGLDDANPGILVGNVLYWSSKSVRVGSSYVSLNLTDDIIEFDLDRQSLAVIKGPPELNGSLLHQIIQTDDGAVGLAVFSQGRFKMWERKANRHGGATWLLQKTVEMHTILGRPSPIKRSVAVLGYDEDNGVIFLHVGSTVYMVELMSMQSKKLYKSYHSNRCYPFTSFYAQGGCAGAGMLPLV
ncbi:uncharacterized protein LOC124696342 [Lolium rigidum]|uniref:uncharacterized protein LOC124696342 n=1 Tax=Lolium rigidum TaxID=89674 RepID=UPI001F5C1636|nr:uncharacterized protein LOC124696342 [Lolium rigidum]